MKKGEDLEHKQTPPDLPKNYILPPRAKDTATRNFRDPEQLYISSPAAVKD
jgi:hypothetical protein